MMKKITLLAVTMFSVFTAFSQLLFFDDLSDQAVATSYTIIDNDNRTINSFYTDQGVFTNGAWQIVNFGGTTGVAHFSTASFAGADSCLAASDWKILPALDFTNVTSYSLTFDRYASSVGELSVFATTSIAGAAPVVSDFTNPAIATFSANNTWANTGAIDLSSLAGNATVYIAVVNTTAACNADIIGVRNITVKAATAIELALTSLSLVTDDLTNGALAFNYSVLNCGASTQSTSITFLNEGGAPINDTVFVGYVFQDDNNVTSFSEDTILNFLTTPLAVGASFTHTFSNSPNFSSTSITVFTAYVFIDGEGDPDTNNEINHILVNAPTTDLANNRYYTSFEVDFNDVSVLANTLGWKFENNGLLSAYSIEDFSVFGDGADFYTDGTYVLSHDYLGDGTSFPAANNYAFSPCLNLTAGKSYKYSFFYNTVLGSQAPHTIDFSLNTAPTTTSSAQAITTTIFNAEQLTQHVAYFTSTVSGVHHFTMRDRSAIGLIMTFDELEILELEVPTASVSLVGSSLTPGGGVEYCDSTITISYVVTGPPASLTINWGDGNTTTVNNPQATGQATHTYGSLGTFNVTASATNIAGTGTSSPVAVEIAGPPTYVAGFTTVISGGTVTIVDSSTPVAGQRCSNTTFTWSFGDGSANIVHAGNSPAPTSHTYSEPGTYTIALIIQTPGVAPSVFQVEVTIASVNINEVNFAQALSIFPNPTSEIVNVAFELNKVQNVELSVISIDGKVLAQNNIENALNVNSTFNVSNFNNGVYFIRIKTEEGISTQRFVVSKK